MKEIVIEFWEEEGKPVLEQLIHLIFKIDENAYAASKWHDKDDHELHDPNPKNIAPPETTPKPINEPYTSVYKIVQDQGLDKAVSYTHLTLPTICSV